MLLFETSRSQWRKLEPALKFVESHKKSKLSEQMKKPPKLGLRYYSEESFPVPEATFPPTRPAQGKI